MRAYRLGLYEKAMPSSLSWSQKLLCAKEAQFDFVEMSIDETEEKLARLQMSKEQRFALMKEMKEIGVSIQSICLSGHRKYPLGSSNKVVESRALEIMEQAIILASDLGVRIIQLAGYDVYYETSTAETVDRFIRNLKKSVDMAAAYGVLLGFETMETPFMNTVEKARTYVDLVDTAYLHIYPDAGNITNAAKVYDIAVDADLRSGKGRIVGVHLKETIPGHFREVPFGTGHVDFKKIITTSWELGARHYVTELWDIGDGKWEQAIQEAGASMRTILDQMK